VQSKLNQVGQNVSKLRRRRGWTLGELAAKLELVGCHFTPEVLADIEMRRCAVTDAQIALLSEVLRVQIKDLYIHLPKK
jgi:transcriptional regulator with XRE-family HTH domain